jgi:hypothetical protein
MVRVGVVLFSYASKDILAIFLAHVLKLAVASFILVPHARLTSGRPGAALAPDTEGKGRSGGKGCLPSVPAMYAEGDGLAHVLGQVRVSSSPGVGGFDV